MAKTLKWTDNTSYSRGERGHVPPRTWTTTMGPFRITVTRKVHLDGWYLHVPGLATDTPLGDKVTLEAAQQMAVNYMVNVANDILKSVS